MNYSIPDLLLTVNSFSLPCFPSSRSREDAARFSASMIFKRAQDTRVHKRHGPENVKTFKPLRAGVQPVDLPLRGWPCMNRLLLPHGYMEINILGIPYNSKRLQQRELHSNYEFFSSDTRRELGQLAWQELNLYNRYGFGNTDVKKRAIFTGLSVVSFLKRS